MKRFNPNADETDLDGFLAAWRQKLVTRRRFLQALTGGTVASLFPWPAPVADDNASQVDEAARWRVLDFVLQHLLPSEPDAPGAKEIDALGYFRFIVADASIDADEREFITRGAIWLEDMSRDIEHVSFVDLDELQRERVLRKIEQSSAGENWLSTLLTYLFEALLADPAYRGNANGLGWQWLKHIPGFPHPPANKRYPELLKR
jgi:gluconate 2-dehydrogenase gamma chain